jgi:protein-S-isoprenylcysteine O-methyltransferase Ste14
MRAFRRQGGESSPRRSLARWTNREPQTGVYCNKPPMRNHPRLYAAFLLLETYVLPLLFLYFAWANVFFLHTYREEIVDLVDRMTANQREVQDVFLFSVVCRAVLQVGFNLLVATKLLVRRRTGEAPDRLCEVLVPLLATFLTLGYNLISHLPQEYNALLLPEAARLPATVFGGCLSVIGMTIAMAAVFNLGSSFAVFVEAGQIVERGLYGYMRHPIYFGYLLHWLGMALVRHRLYTLSFVIVWSCLMIIRALIEEQKLCRSSAEYRAYRERTPFFPVP